MGMAHSNDDPTREATLALEQGRARSALSPSGQLAYDKLSRTKLTGPGKLTPAQEADYALARGVARETLSPSVQIDYDKLRRARLLAGGAAAEAFAGTSRGRSVAAKPGPGPARQAGSDGYAIASLVLSIVWMWGLGALLAVIFGHVSANQAKARGEQANGMAVAGLILGYIGLVAAIVITIVVIAAVSHSNACDPSNPSYPYC
jgi:Domain of unknown function (DUF4190)